MLLKVLLVDDQTLVRQGITSLLALSEEVQVVAQADDGEQVVALVNEHLPDVILMDIRMPRVNGIDAVKALHQAGLTTPVIMLTTFDDHQLVMAALQAGAKGYLLKDVSLDILVTGIKDVAAGKTLIQPSITEKVLQGLQGLSTDFESFSEPEPLSEKEQEILRLMAAGCSNREIALAMHKSEGTVKNQVSTILAKMGVRDRTRAVLKAIESGII
ncbi:response regulator [Planctobacterium marinum]|uniref:response regulator n=1 Tax=Planctobacterium marinum TaxID=1631968 RepID=UPI001E640855|nr:response regulator transcription factor [Planctobacterium marinum]MCC2605785.1 response regulator transcription factor [Planctobacterium marinum]